MMTHREDDDDDEDPAFTVTDDDDDEDDDDVYDNTDLIQCVTRGHPSNQQAL